MYHLKRVTSGVLPVQKDAANGNIMIALAAWVGDRGLACEQPATAIRYTSLLTYRQLELLPW